MSTFATINHIEITPGVCGGRPRISGHRIRVQDVAVWHEMLGLSPDEIASDHPGIALADIHAALAYYHDHRDEIHRDMEADEALIEEMKRTVPSKLLQKLVGPDAGPHPLSS
jgi:uncharacterized protein (DUF433 family)